MKLKLYKSLFHVFSFLSDKTNGSPFFVKYKLLLGTLIIGIAGTMAHAQKKTEVSCYDTIPPNRHSRPAEISCYKVHAPAKEKENASDSIEVKGRVVDEEGEPLIGTAIRIQDKVGGTVANINGYFKLKAKPNDILVFSMIGFLQKEIPISEVRDSVTVAMEMDSVELSCYIVVVADPSTNRLIQPIKPIDSEKEEIKGTVKDNFGEPLVGVSINIKGAASGVVTDQEGNFSIRVKANDVLVFSYIGFERKEAPISQIRKDSSIVLKEEPTILCYEVIVVNDPRYRDDIYSPGLKPITKISYTEIYKKPVSSVGNLEAFQKWVQSNIQYSEQMKKDKLKGEVILSFAIDKKGKLVDKKVIGKLSKEADKEALRALSLSEAWKPGINYDGKPIKTTMTISINFGNE